MFARRKTTVDLTQLLEQITEDCEQFKKTHSGFYNALVWWELEKERLASQYRLVTVDRRKPVKMLGQWKRRNVSLFEMHDWVWILGFGAVIAFLAIKS